MLGAANGSLALRKCITVILHLEGVGIWLESLQGFFEDVDEVIIGRGGVPSKGPGDVDGGDLGLILLAIGPCEGN